MNCDIMKKILDLVDTYGYSITIEKGPRVVFRKSGEEEPRVNLHVGARNGRAGQVRSINYWLDELLFKEKWEERHESERKDDGCAEAGDATGDTQTDR